jgi:hypothetical protein
LLQFSCSGFRLRLRLVRDSRAVRGSALVMRLLPASRCRSCGSAEQTADRSWLCRLLLLTVRPDRTVSCARCCSAAAPSWLLPAGNQSKAAGKTDTGGATGFKDMHDCVWGVWRNDRTMNRQTLHRSTERRACRPALLMQHSKQPRDTHQPS